jgi:hypothetical protein
LPVHHHHNHHYHYPDHHRRHHHQVLSFYVRLQQKLEKRIKALG